MCIMLRQSTNCLIWLLANVKRWLVVAPGRTSLERLLFYWDKVVVRQENGMMNVQFFWSPC